MTARKKKRSKIWKWLGILVIAGSLIAVYGGYKIFGPNTGSFGKGEFLYIPTGAVYEDVMSALKKESFIKDSKSFDLIAQKAGYPDNVKAGKYKIKKGMSNYEIVKMLRAGKQASVKIVINKFRTKNDLINFLAEKLEPDTMVWNYIFSDANYLSQFGLDSTTAIAAFIPDTYEFYWNTKASKVFERLAGYYQKFWNEERIKKAEALGLKKTEIITLASIVEEETNNKSERPTIASVYLNRLKKGMKLQADPTAKFAYGDFTIKRVLNTHTTFQSPYNTYYTMGLPPGPICTPSKNSIDAVLNPAKTDYLYFCANTNGSGTHLFAENYADHLKNARAYHEHLNNK